MQKLRKVLKLGLDFILLGFCFSFVFYQTWKCFDKFLHYPKASHLTLLDSGQTVLPDISICPQDGAKDKSLDELIEEIMFINGTTYSNMNADGGWNFRFWIYHRILHPTEPNIIYQAFGTKCFTFSFPANITQIGVTRLEMYFRNKVYVKLHTPGLFFKEMKYISVDGNIVGVPNPTEGPFDTTTYTYHFEGVSIKADLSYEVITELNTDEKPCHDESSDYSKDNCILTKIHEDTMELVGCTSDYGLNKSNVCTDNDKSKKAEENYLNTVLGASKIKECLDPCTKIISSLSIRSSQETNVNAYLGIDFPSEVKVMTTYPAYEVLSLIAEIGGYVGLFLGVSVLDLKTIGELALTVSNNK